MVVEGGGAGRCAFRDTLHAQESGEKILIHGVKTDIVDTQNCKNNYNASQDFWPVRPVNAESTLDLEICRIFF